MDKIRVGILGATGAVGQKFIRLLHNHPWFEIAAIAASERSAGKKYWEAVNWIESVPLPETVAAMDVQACDPTQMEQLSCVFSGLDSSVAGTIEKAYAEAGIPVISNAKNYRMDDAVPLLVPEVNPDHISLIKNQNFTEDGSGWIVTNPNCVSIPLSLAMKPIYDTFGIEAINLTSMQAVSGAGYPGVPSLDIMGNVVPMIAGEEPKIHVEPLKLLGTVSDSNSIDYAKFPVQATAVRVPTLEGHLLSITVKCSDTPDSEEAVKEAYRSWLNPIADLELPSSPAQALFLHENEFYPQPRLHADRDNGMQVGIGRIRMSNIFDFALVALGHNTIRGAAGCSILNAELLTKKGLITKR